MNEPIPVHSTELVPEHTVANMSPVNRQEGSLVRPSAPIAQIEQAFRDYTALCERLLVPDDYQQIGQKSFRKKSAWRKLATAFGVSVELLRKEYEREGRHIIRAEVMSRAVAPNGRFMDGLGACDAFERCCEVPCKKKSWSNHTCCTNDCNGFVHFSKPNHDIPATAMTRATNRACADLFGMGEVSAEEVTGDDHPAPQPQPPVDPEAWFRENGWENRADHDAVRDFLRQAASALDDRAKEALKEWRKGEGLEWSTAWSRAQADAFAHKIALLGGAEPEPTPEPPHAPLTVAEAESVGNALVEHLKGLDRTALEAEIASRGNPINPQWSEDKLRQKLGAVMLGEGWRPAQEPPTANLLALSPDICAWCGTQRTDTNELVDYREDGTMHARCHDERLADKAIMAADDAGRAF